MLLVVLILARLLLVMLNDYFVNRCYLALLAFHRLLLEVCYQILLWVFFLAATRAQIVEEPNLLV